MDENEATLREMEKKIAKGLRESFRKMVEFKRYKKSPVVVSKKGKIIYLDPFKIDIEKGEENQ